MNIEQLYETTKAILPIAKEIFINSKLGSKCEDIQKFINAIDSLGGISTFSNLFNNKPTSKNQKDKSITPTQLAPKETNEQLSLEEMPIISIIE